MSPYGWINIGHMPRINNKDQCSTEGRIDKKREKKRQQLCRQTFEIILMTAEIHVYEKN